MAKAAEQFLKTLGETDRRCPVSAATQGNMPMGAWQAQARSALTASLGEMPPVHAPKYFQMEESIREDGYTRTRIAYMSEEGLPTPGYVLVPEGVSGKVPVVLALHGHGYGVRDIVGLMPDGSPRRGDPGYHKDFGVSLCRRGMVVIAPELLGFGDLRLDLEENGADPGHSSCHQLSMALLMCGRTMGGVRAHQAMRALSCAKYIAQADTSRMGVMGISGGGLVATLVAALDPRIRAAVISGYACTFRHSIMSVTHCVDNYFPGLLKDLELPDVLSLIAPKPMLWEAGRYDSIFPVEGVFKAEETVRAVYAHMGAEDAFSVDLFEDEHCISGAMSYDFLHTHLSK